MRKTDSYIISFEIKNFWLSRENNNNNNNMINPSHDYHRVGNILLVRL